MSYSTDGCKFKVDESTIHCDQKKRKGNLSFCTSRVKTIQKAGKIISGNGTSKRDICTKKSNLNALLTHENFLEVSHRTKC